MKPSTVRTIDNPISFNIRMLIRKYYRKVNVYIPFRCMLQSDGSIMLRLRIDKSGKGAGLVRYDMCRVEKDGTVYIKKDQKGSFTKIN